MGQAAHGSHVIEALRQHATSWFVQVPALWTARDLPTPQKQVLGGMRWRIPRELAEAVEILTQKLHLVLVLEGLSWGEASTLDWLAYVARRRAPARLLVLGTYRP